MTNVMITVPQVDHLLKTCVFLGFEADPSFNIVSRIRGPNVSFFFIHLPHFSFRLVLCSSFSFSICSRQLVYFVFSLVSGGRRPLILLDHGGCGWEAMLRKGL